ILERAQTLAPNSAPARFKPVTEKVKTFSGHAAVANTGLVGMQLQSVGVHPCLYVLQCRLSLLLGIAQDHKVIGVAHHAVAIPIYRKRPVFPSSFLSPVRAWRLANVRQASTAAAR